MNENPGFMNLKAGNIVLLRHYAQDIVRTDRLPSDDCRPVLLGLFGEVGSVMAITKKRYREQEAYPEDQRAVEEELGDVFWYFAALCRRLNIQIDDIFSSAPVSPQEALPTPDETLLQLGKAAAALLDVRELNDHSKGLLRAFVYSYMRIVALNRVNLSDILDTNIGKVRGRFLDPLAANLPTFDDDFPDEEKLPAHFEIRFMQRISKQGYLQWNGVFLGDPLTDNTHEPDGYRFHDVFHLAHAAILHWSPTFRALIKQKRKSDPRLDEVEDGGRAIVVEEGLTAWIFSRAKQLAFFEQQNSISFDMLKTVRQFVRGYEVEQCPLRLWELAILEGYKAFRQICTNEGGIVIGDRATRTLTYRPD